MAVELGLLLFSFGCRNKMLFPALQRANGLTLKQAAKKVRFQLCHNFFVFNAVLHKCKLSSNKVPMCIFISPYYVVAKYNYKYKPHRLAVGNHSGI